MPAPANDNVAGAELLLTNTTQALGDNTLATQESGEVKYSDALVASGTTGLKTVWYKWIASRTGSINFNSFGTGYDTVIGLYTSSVNPATGISDLTVVASNDDASSGGAAGESRVIYSVTAGVTYYVQFTGYNSAAFGPYTVNYFSPASTTSPYLTGNSVTASFTTSGTVVSYNGGGNTGANCYDVLCVNSDNTVTTPSGWSQTVSAVTNQGAYIFVKAENGTNTATINLGGGVSTSTSATWIRVANSSGVDTAASGSAQINGTSGSTTPSFTSSALTGSNELALAFAALHVFAGSTPTATSWSSGYAEQGNAVYASSPGVYGSVALKVPAGSGAESPAFSWTNATNDRYLLFTAFKPVGGGSQNGAAALTAASSLTAGATVNLGGAVAMTAASSIAAAGAVVKLGAVAMTAGTSLTATAVMTGAASVPMTAASNLSSAAVTVRPGASAMTAASSLSTAAVPVRFGATTMTAASGLTTTATQSFAAAVSMTAISSLTAAATTTGVGAAVLSAVSALSAAASTAPSGGVAMTAVSGVTVGGLVVSVAAVSMGAGSSLTVATVVTRFGAATMAANSALTASALGGNDGAAVLTAASQLTASGQVVQFGAISMTAAALLNSGATTAPVTQVVMTASATLTGGAIAVRSGAALLTAITALTAAASVGTVAVRRPGILTPGSTRSAPTAGTTPRPRLTAGTTRGSTYAGGGG